MPMNQSDDGFDYLKEHTKDYPHSGRLFSNICGTYFPLSPS